MLANAVGAHGGECLGSERNDVGRMIGASARHLEPRDVAQIGNRRGRREAVDERRERLAVLHEDRAVGRLLSDVDPRHLAEELVSDQALDDGEARGERGHQAGQHVVAIDREAALRLAARRPAHGRRHSGGRIEQRLGKGRLNVGKVEHDCPPERVLTQQRGGCGAAAR